MGKNRRKVNNILNKILNKIKDRFLTFTAILIRLDSEIFNTHDVIFLKQ